MPVAGIVDGHNTAGLPEIVAIDSSLLEQGGQDGRVAVLAMDDVRPCIKQDHQVERCLLQENIHGKIVKVAAAPIMGWVFFLLFRGVGIDAQFFPVALSINQVNIHSVQLGIPEQNALPAVLGSIVHVHLKRDVMPCEIQLFRIHEAIAWQNDCH